MSDHQDDSRQIAAAGLAAFLIILAICLGIGGCTYLCNVSQAKIEAAKHLQPSK